MPIFTTSARERAPTSSHRFSIDVGESSAGRLYETLTRHFSQWRRYKGFWRGQYGEGHDPGLTYDRGRVEVAARVTSPSDAIEEEARLIRRLNFQVAQHHIRERMNLRRTHRHLGADRLAHPRQNLVLHERRTRRHAIYHHQQHHQDCQHRQQHTQPPAPLARRRIHLGRFYISHFLNQRRRQLIWASPRRSNIV